MRAIVALVVLVTFAGVASAQRDRGDVPLRAQYRVGGRPHADVPFELNVIVEGLAETPQVDLPPLEIPGATVTPMTAQIDRGMELIVNGRRVRGGAPTWVLRYRVVTSKDGQLRLPSMTITQGKTKVETGEAGLPVDAVPLADDMKLTLELPARPIYVGETVEAKLVWLFRRRPTDQSLNVPMLGLDGFTVSAPPVVDKRRVHEVVVGAKEIELPYEADETTVDGVQYARRTMTFFAALRAMPANGKIEIPASSLVAALAVGRPDFFGESPTRLFRTSDVARTIEVKPLPESDRPPTFAGAVGQQFAIEVRTSRSVVQLGEPVELAVTIKGNQRLDALALGKLDGEGRLPKDKFTVPTEPPTGVLSEDGKTKTFKVDAQVTGPTTEIPAIAFSYFDPVKGAYQTTKSEPIALSVKGGSVIGADSVVSARPASQDKTRNGNAAEDLSSVKAELALSTPGQVDDHPLDGTMLWVLVGLLYALPLGLLGLRSWQLRTATLREEAGEVRAARRRVEELLDRADKSPARELAGPLAAAFRDLARVLDSPPDQGLLARLETESFAPSAADKPLSADLRSDAAGLLRRWTTDARRRRERRGAKAAAGIAILVGLAVPAQVRADTLDDGRAAYEQAMGENGATQRKAAFARAATALADAVRAHPDRPELLADWGNAALGAGDVATATLAYRRALALDGGTTRARTNLAWLRSRQPEQFRPIATAGATDTLLFFHHWPRSRRLVVGAIAFAAGTLLLVPWSGRRRRGAIYLAALPLVAWLALVASVVFEDRHTDDAVVMDNVVLRAADSAGAPAAIGQPLPRGAEVTILERRAAWTLVQIPGGASGWVPEGAVERVAVR